MNMIYRALRCLVFTLLVINSFSFCIFGREYILEVAAAKNGFTITTNIPKVGAKQAAVAKGSDSIPTVTFNASAQDFLLTEAGRSIEIKLDKSGQITITKLNIPDVLRVSNQIGDISFDGPTPQKAQGLKLVAKNFTVKAHLTVTALEGIFSNWFINDGVFTIAQSNPVENCSLSCMHVDNNKQLIINGNLQLAVQGWFQDKGTISGTGNCFIKTNKFLSEVNASISLDGKLEILPSLSLSNNALHCAWPCVLEHFAQQANQNPESAGWPTGFLGIGQEACLKSNERERGKFGQETACSEILLMGPINVGDLILSAANISLQASIHVKNDCTITPSYVVRNSGTLYVKNALTMQGGDFLYNDVNSIISAGQNITLNFKKIVANVSGVISANGVTITADTLINTRGEASASKSGDINGDNFVYMQAETYPLGYIFARGDNLVINVGEFYQEGSFLRASNDTYLNVKNKFVNHARELNEFYTYVDKVENVGKKQAKAEKKIQELQQKKEQKKKKHPNKKDKINQHYDDKINKEQAIINKEKKNPAPKKIQSQRVTHGNKAHIQYEASTISAGGKVVITLKDTKVEISGPQTHYAIKDFHNTGTIQGQQILELTSDEKAKVVNGFTHKKQPAVFEALPKVIDLEDEMLANEFEIQKQNKYYYKVHPLFNENEQLYLLQEVAINATEVKKDTLFLMSPLLEAMSLEFALHRYIGKIKFTSSEDHYEQFKMLQAQGWVYALIHGNIVPIAGVNQGAAPGKIALSDAQKKDYQALIKRFNGKITPEEFAKRFSLLEAKTHVVTLSDRQIGEASIAFIFYRVKNHDGKFYLHPYLHPDKAAFEKMRHADGSLQGGDVKITGGNVQNFGFIKADKELLIKVTSFLNEKPLQERLNGMYKIIKTKPGGEYEARNATINVQDELTFKGGTGTATAGSNNLKSEKGNINLVDQQATNPQALNHATQAVPSTLTAATNNNLDAQQNVNVRNSQTAAGQNTTIKAGSNANIETTATKFVAKDEVECTDKKKSCKSWEHRTEEGFSATPAAVFSGANIDLNAGQKNELAGATLKAGGTIKLDAPENKIKPVVVETGSTADATIKKPLFYDHTKTKTSQESIIQSTLQADQIIIKSSEFDTTLEAVVMYGGQLVHIVSGRNTIFAGTQLHASMQQKGWSFGISFLGSTAIQALADGNYKGAVIALVESDPLIAAIAALSKAQDKADKLAASEYVNIEALRALVYLSKASKLPVVTGVGQRLKLLNGEGKFRPHLTFSLGFHKANSNVWETTPSEINAMKLVVESAQETGFKDGTKVTAQESKVSSNVVTFTPATKTEKSSSRKVGFDITFGFDTFGVGFNVGKGKHDSVSYKNAVFNVAAQTWQAEDMHGQGVTLNGRVGQFDVKNIHLESVQNREKGKNVNVGASASTSGSFSGSFNYHNVDNAWINQRSCLEFQELHGHVAMLKLIAADIIAHQKNSTFKADKTEGKELRDRLRTFGLGLGISFSPNDVVPVTADIDYLNTYSGGTHKAYASEHVQTGQTDNVVRNEKDKFVEDKKINTHTHFVAAWIDTKQVKQALNDYKELFAHNQVSLKTFNQKKQTLEKILGIDTFLYSDEAESNEEVYQAPSEENNTQDSQKSSDTSSEKQPKSSDKVKDNKQPNVINDTAGGMLVKCAHIVAGSNEENSAKIDLMEQNSHDNAFDYFQNAYDRSWKAMVNDMQSTQRSDAVEIAFSSATGKTFKVSGSMLELSDMAERLDAFVDDRQAVLLAGPTPMGKIVNIMQKFLKFADRYVPFVGDSYSLMWGEDFDTGLAYRNWTGRVVAAAKIALQATAIKVASVFVNHVGVPVARWLANTKTGAVIVDALETGLSKTVEKSKYAWKRFMNWVGFEGEQAAGKVAGNQAKLSSDQIYKQVRSKGNLKVQPDKLGKHIEGHKNFDPKGTKSIFVHRDSQGLVDKFAGTGIPDKGLTAAPGEPGYKEIVDFGEMIGYDVNPKTGVRTPTSKGKIHYAKDGVHIVPFLEVI